MSVRRGGMEGKAYLELLLVQPVENVARAVPDLGVRQSALDCFLREAVVERVWRVEEVSVVAVKEGYLLT